MKTSENKRILRVAKYERVSSDKQAKLGDSLRDQDESLNEYISNRDDMILYDTYIDDGISGQKLDRDDFGRLMNDVAAGNIDVIIFTKLDRWFRSLRHYLNTQAFLEDHGVGWIAVRQEYYDTTTAFGRAFVAQSMTWAELEAQNDSERILAVFDNKVKNGEVISGTVPLGLKIVDKHFQPSDDAPLVREIFEYYSRYNNLTQLMLHMREEYNFYRTTSTYRKMLSKKIYIGEYRGNKNYCPPLIDHELFDSVQSSLSRNIRHNKKHDYIFPGLVRCAECGGSAAATQLVVPGHPKKDGTRKRYHHSVYKCKKHFNEKLCINTKVIYETVLERWMLEHIKDLLNNYITEYTVSVAPIVDTDAKRKRLLQKISKLKELYLNDLITLDEYKVDKSEYETQLSQLPVSPAPPKDISHLYSLLDMDIETVYKSFSINEKAQFWRSFVKYIYFDNNRNFRIIFL